MFGSILHRMIFWELVKVFFLCLVAITGILLMAGIVAEASQQGLNPAQILAIIPLLIPSTLPYTIPATTLFATCMVYGRLAADNEILAIRASGINLARVVGPGVLLGVLVSGATMGLYYRTIPYTHHLMRTMFLADVEELLYSLLKKNGQVTLPNFDYSMFVKNVQGRRLIKPVFKHKDAHGEIDACAMAETAELHVDMPNNKLLVRMFIGSAWSRNESHAYFEDKVWEVEAPDLGDKKNRRPRDMTWQQMYDNLDMLAVKEAKNQTAIDAVQEIINTGNATRPFFKHLNNLKHQGKVIQVRIREIQAEQHMRPALSLGCLFFVLVGCPVGIWFGRSDYLSSFITCFLPIVFIYYPLLLCGTGMAKDGKFGTMLTVWAADAVMATVGVGLFWRLLKN